MDNLSGNSIQCTSCKAPVEMVGSLSRAKILACGYCGTVMDCKDDFRALYAFMQVEKPSSNLRIGMCAVIHHISFTISALLVYESLQGDIEEWIEYQLYAPNYGYAYIIIRGQSCCFLRKTYNLPNPNLWLLKEGDCFVAKQQEFVIEEFFLGRVLYSEGALLDKIKQNKRDKQCFAKNLNQQYYFSKYNLNKVDYYQGFLIDKTQLEQMFTYPDVN